MKHSDEVLRDFFELDLLLPPMRFSSIANGASENLQASLSRSGFKFRFQAEPAANPNMKNPAVIPTLSETCRFSIGAKQRMGL